MSSSPLVIAIDSSTTSTKAIVVDDHGNILALGRGDIEMHTPAIDFYEHAAIQWWESTHWAIGQALDKLDVSDKRRIQAIGITHQRESFAPFDKLGNPLRRGILWLDSRATEQIRKYGSPEIHELSGKPAGVTPGIYKMAWVKEHEPEIFPLAHKVVDVAGYLTFRLTGEWATSVACADSLGLLEIEKHDWADTLLQIAGVTRSQMARLVEPGDVMGYLLPGLCLEWGIKSVPIIAGMGDGQAAGIGAAAVRSEIAFLNMGTAVNAGVESSVYKYDSEFRTHVSGIKDNYVFEVLQSSGSYLAGWYRHNFGDPELKGAPDPHLDQAAEAISAGCDGLVTLPYWNAVQSPWWDSVARGAVVGWRGIHTPAHMYRSILESIGYEMRYNLNSLERGTGTRIQSIRAMGGGTRSKLWRQIMADILGIEITICKQDEISAMGAGILAMAASEEYRGISIPNMAEQMAQTGEVIEPQKVNAQRYQEMAVIQHDLYPALQKISNRLYEFTEKNSSK